jgi:lysozyme family protein
MAQLTWRNVDAPNFSGSLDGYKTFSDLINRAGATATGAVTAYDDSISNGVNQGIRAAMQRYQDPAARQQALASGEFLQGIDPRRVSTDTFNAMDKGVSDLTAQNTNMYNMKRTQEKDAALDASVPDLLIYAGAAARGDTAGMRTAQGAASFGNLRGDQLLDMFKNVGGIANTGVGIRKDVQSQEASAIASEIIPGIGVASDIPALLFKNPKWANAAPEVKQGVQNLIAAAGWGSAFGPQAGAVGGGGITPGFAGATESILRREGGYTSSDGASGAPANFGINQKANPDIDVKNLTKDKAVQLYKERYWDAIGGDSLPPAIQGTAMDAAVNQGPGNAKKWVEQSGGDPVKFNALRRAHYEDLLKQPKHAENRSTWMERLDYYDKQAVNGGTDAVAGLIDAAKRAKLNTPAELNSAGASATLDAKMALSMKNLTGLSSVMAKGGDLSNPSDIATALNEKWKTIPHPVLMEEINRISEKYEITPALAGEILLNKGMGSGSVRFTLPQWLTGNAFKGTGYEPNEKRIEALANALKTPMGQSRVAENDAIVAIGAAVDAAKDKFTAANQEYLQLRARAADNPALAGSVLRSEQRLATAEKQYQDAILRQDNSKVAKQEFPDKTTDKPPPVAKTIAGKVIPQQGVTGSWGDASTAIAKAITEEPAKDSPLRATWLRQQTEARKASEAAAKEAERIAKLEQERLVAERAKAYLAKTGKVLLAPQ